jgi:hypothetical protein
MKNNIPISLPSLQSNNFTNIIVKVNIRKAVMIKDI